MAEYRIDQKIKAGEEHICNSCIHNRVCRANDNSPCIECNQYKSAVDVVEVRRGEWVVDEDHWGHPYLRCSECHILYDKKFEPSNYCPNCGAKMEVGKT